MATVSLSRFEGDFEGMIGCISLYRRGLDETYLSHYSWIYKQLEAVRAKLETIGMYERCREALMQAEDLVRQGPERDEEAATLLLAVSRELAHASGSYAKLQRKFKAQNDEGASR